MNIALQAAGLEHLEQLVPLVEAYHRFERIKQSAAVSRRALRPLLEGKDIGRIWLIHAGNDLVGYIAVCFGYSIEFGGRDAFVDEMFIVESHRGQGIGGFALRAVTRAVADYAVKVLHLEVAQNNQRARKLYQSAGFEPRRFSLMSCFIKP